MCRKILVLLKTVFCPFCNSLVGILSLLIPKSKKIVLIGGWFGRRYCDNSRALFEILASDTNFRKVIFVTNNKAIVKRKKKGENGEFIYRKSLKSIWYHLRAGTHVVDQDSNDVLPFFSIRAKKLNLYHGLPGKKIGVDASKTKKPLYLWRIRQSAFSPGHWNKCYYLATSPWVGERFAKAFQLRPGHLVYCSYPRDKYFLESKASSPNGFLPNGAKIVFYFPTFRADASGFDPTFFQKMSTICERLNLFLFYKPHFAAPKTNLKNISKRIIFLKNEVDINPFLPYGDVLISDYSSVFWDFMITGKPVIYYAYDLEEYLSADRGLYLDYSDFCAGPICRNVAELEKAIEKSILFFRDEKTRPDEYDQKLFFMNNYAHKFSIDPILEFINK